MSQPSGPTDEGDSSPEHPHEGATPAQPRDDGARGSATGDEQPGYWPQQPGGYPPGYGQPPYAGGGYGYGVPAGLPVTNGKATASLVTGISTLVLAWCCGFGLLGAVAIVLGVRARSEIRASQGQQTGDGLALAGIITGAIGVVIGLVALVVVIIAVVSQSDTGPVY